MKVAWWNTLKNTEVLTLHNITLTPGDGKSVTYDMKEDRTDPTAVGTKEMANAIIAKIKKA